MTPLAAHAPAESQAWQPHELAAAARQVAVPVVDAEAQVEAMCAAAYQEGHAAGCAEGDARARTQVRGAQEVLLKAAQRIAENEQQWHNALEHNLTVLALAIARHIIGRELRGDAQALADVVRRAIAELPNDQELRVRVHPQDLLLLTTPGASQALTIAPGRELKWIADSTIEEGGCVVEARHQVADAQIDSAIERITRQLLHG
jgi:flagellar biosynthesis/type III secretory pathway protein FliH